MNQVLQVLTVPLTMSILADTLQLLIGIVQEQNLSSICTANIYVSDVIIVVCI